MTKTQLFLCLLCWPLLLGAASRSFDGTDDEIAMGDFTFVSTGDATVCAWWKGTEDASSDFILGQKSNITTARGYALYQQTDDTMRMNGADNTLSNIASGTTDTDGAWFFVCGQWTGASDLAEVFVNGTSEGTNSTNSVGSLDTTDAHRFGEDVANLNDANGLIAFGLLENRLITAVELAELQYHADGLAFAVSGWWPLWDGASPENDLSGNNRDGTVAGNGGASQDGPPVMVGYLPI